MLGKARVCIANEHFNKVMLRDGAIKIYKENTQDRVQSNDKPWYWNKNKNTATDGATNTR